MSVEIRESFQRLAERALQAGYHGKAAHLIRLGAVVEKAKAKKGLAGLETPKWTIEWQRQAEAGVKRLLWYNHLAIVAREALRVNKNGEFVHSSKMDVVHALRAKMAKGASGLIRDYKDSTLARHISAAGEQINKVRGGVFHRDNDLHYREKLSLSSLGIQREFLDVVPSRRWRRTLRYARNVLPENATAADVGFFLISFPHIPPRFIEKGRREPRHVARRVKAA